MASFNLAWFIEKTFNNQQGKPLRLESFQQIMLELLWYKKFPMVLATRGAGKTFILALYALLRALLVPGSKIVIVGAGFRQAKLVFKYIEQLYESSPLIKEAIAHWGGPKYGSDAATLRVGLSSIQAIPIGDGEKIRGMRATVLIADEFASIPEDIFDIVIAPFTAVHMNPAERASQKRFIKRLEGLGADQRLVQAIQSTQDFGNQIVISGTPSYKHNHFYKRYCVYMAFLKSKGNPQHLKRALEEQQLASTGRHQEINDDDVRHAETTWRQYAVYQLPYTALPEGFMEEDIIRTARASYPGHRFAMEYLSQFPDDTDGFIKRSWIDRATPRGPEQQPVFVELYGDPRASYVMGVDPARFNDNLGIVVLKITERGKEFVYCQAWDRTQFSVSAQRIREIVKRFHVSYIAMDTGGGGEQIREWLCKKVDEVQPQDFIWVIADQMEKYTGDKTGMAAPGRKILEMVDFTSSWISQAAHGVEADIEQGNILFPYRADADRVYDQYMK
ncbi:MAG: terminase family protein, partial [Nitrososphaera sp.]|nr:terminase family protein [Nitrososphaera sp.]